MNSKIMVSISCITYNHEKYVKEALDGMLMQKTNFKYEILIHDDASTDNTAKIIKEYQQKYPDIVKPILQTVNQMSSGVKKFSYKYNIKRAKGKYIAMCEGDDYWIDESKLQKQVDYMESNPKCTFSFHNALLLDEVTNKKDKLVIPWSKFNGNFYNPIKESYTVGELSSLGYIPTASFLFPRYILEKPPKWYFDAPVGDTPIKLIASSHGYAYYINEPMSVYRFKVPNSATTKWRTDNKDTAVKHCEQFIEMFNSFNKYSNYKYNDSIEMNKTIWEVQKSIITGDYNKMNKLKYLQYANSLSGFRKMRIYLLIYFPLGLKVLEKVKSALMKHNLV